MFFNRNKELSLRSEIGIDATFMVIFGRRRVGKTAKTALVHEWGRNRDLAYTQAIEAATPLQIL